MASMREEDLSSALLVVNSFRYVSFFKVYLVLKSKKKPSLKKVKR